MKIMFTKITVLLLTTLLVLPLGSAIAEDSKKKTYSQQELDTMMAPVALYPDSLLSQILMASTYPGDVTEAVKWSKKNTKKTGDKAVKAVQKKSWDPSVMSLVAFPSVLDMMGQKPDWVEDMGNAFLSDSEKVMDTVQSLRKKAKDEGNLKTSKEQTVKVEDKSDPQIIIIETSDPEVVYVPTYNPTVIYGTWWWPSYYPYYYRPVGYGFGTGIVTGIGFGIGIGITNSLWGGFNWRRHDVDINVNRHNNINVNSNRINSSSRNTSWKHNSSNVNSVNRANNFNKNTNNQINKDKASSKISGSEQRNDFRGRDADREKAKTTLESRGVDPAKGRQELKGSGGSKARDTVSKANNSFDSSKVSKNLGSATPANLDSGKVSKNLGSTKASNLDSGKISNIDASRKSDFSSNKSSFNDHALSDVGNARGSSSNISRGNSSNRSFQNSGGMSRGGGGGGGRSRGGGGGGRRR
jgi:hypothetical protein